MNNMNNTDINFLPNNIMDINNVKTISVNYIDDIKFNKNCISVFSMNISSLKAHINELIIYLSSINNRFYIIVLSETWIKDECDIKINGYQVFHSLGLINKSDGVFVLISDDCTFDNISTQIVENCSSIQLSVNKSRFQYIVTGIYRSQCYNTKQFITSLDDYLSDNDFKSNQSVITEPLFCHSRVRASAQYHNC